MTDNLDRLLADFAPPRPAHGLADRIVAAATLLPQAERPQAAERRRGRRGAWLRRPLIVGGAALGLVFTSAVAATLGSGGRIVLPSIETVLASVPLIGNAPEPPPVRRASVAPKRAPVVPVVAPASPREEPPLAPSLTDRQQRQVARLIVAKRIVEARRDAGLPTPRADRIERLVTAKRIVDTRRAAGLPTPRADRIEAAVERRAAYRAERLGTESVVQPAPVDGPQASAADAPESPARLRFGTAPQFAGRARRAPARAAAGAVRAAAPGAATPRTFASHPPRIAAKGFGPALVSSAERSAPASPEPTRRDKMKKLVLTGLAAVLVSPAAFAEPKTKTVTVDTPRIEASRTIVRDRDAGTVSRDAEVTRKSDGATASRDYDRARTESGVTASGRATNFRGETRSFDYERERTNYGYNASGAATGFNGKSYALEAAGRRGEDGAVRRQIVRNEDGQAIAGRRQSVHRNDNGVVTRRTVSRRAPGFHRPRRGN